jgi:hypothetical protein
MTGMSKAIQLGGRTINKGIMQAILAKEICSCIFNTEMQPPVEQLLDDHQLTEFRRKECLERSGLPISAGLLSSLVKVKLSGPKSSALPLLKANSTILGHVLALKLTGKNQSFTAAYLGKDRGCRLLTDQEVRSKKISLALN